MGMLRVYLKKGNTSYKEKRMVEKLYKAILERKEKDPLFEFEPATNFDDLKTLHDKYCIEDVAFEEVETGTKTEQTSNMSSEETTSESNDGKDDSASIEPKDTLTETASKTQKLINPMNRQSPNIRDYVLNDEYSTQNNTQKAQAAQQTFNEPMNFQEAFEMPDDDNDNKKKDKKQNTFTNTNDPNKNQAQNQNNNQNNQQQNKKDVINPINPNFNNMDDGRKRKSTKRWAKYIVEGVCMLAGKGLVWYATKDINEGKLAEYELNGEMDLRIFTTLEDGQEVTIKQFFKSQCFKAEKLANFDAKEKEELAEVLSEVLLEKGIAPTPMQELITIGVKMLADKGLDVLKLTAENNSILAQLRAMQADKNPPAQEERRERPTYAPPVQEQTVQQPVEQQNTNVPPVHQQEQEAQSVEDIERELKKYEAPSQETIIEKPVETLE
jgi:hypothetical protein